MKSHHFPTLLVSLLVLLGPEKSLSGQTTEETVDFAKARQMMERQRQGETLTPAETAYLIRARAEHERQRQAQPPSPVSTPTGNDIDWAKAKALHERDQRGEKLTPEEKAYLNRALAARATPSNQRKAPEHLTPLTDLGGTDRYEGEDGGLYGEGKNTPPVSHRQAALRQIAAIRPLNAAGEADKNGTIGFISISMSNATQEFARFKQVADASPLKSAQVTIVDCAQGGQAMAEWVPTQGATWTEALRRLAAAKVSPQQVQVAWIKLANKGPSGSLQEHGRKLESDTLAVLHNARAKFPNLRIAYLGSRTYAGYATGNLNPEPYAYESAFAARWLIQRQIKADPELSPASSPLLLWGPYLWADGPKGRKLDDLIWERSDFVADGVHPSETGRQKVANLLLNFLTTDPLAKPWFAAK